MEHRINWTVCNVSKNTPLNYRLSPPLKYGTEETVGFFQTKIVKKGPPKTYAVNNSTIVVYDDYGDPWLHCIQKFSQNALDVCFNVLEISYHVRNMEVYVPHSDDAGGFWGIY